MESGGAGGGGRRRRSDEKLESANLRDFLRVKEDNDRRNSLACLTLSAVLGEPNRPQPVPVNRTLLDIIREDPNSGYKKNKKSWKAFRDKFSLRRAGAARTSTVPIPASDVSISNPNRSILRGQSMRFSANISNPDPESLDLISSGESHAELNSLPSNQAMMLRQDSSRVPWLASVRYGRGADEAMQSNLSEDNSPEPAEETSLEESDGEMSAEEGGGRVPTVRMSLMALLADTDQEMGLDGSTYIMDDEEEEDEEEEEEERQGGGEYNACCVCMVRHKGAAFIPCGHTFCRLCSRELWVQRGSCPLCNGFIVEILDIFC